MKYIALLILPFLFVSCSDKIDLEIPQSSERVSFDGVLSDVEGNSYVTIQNSIDYTDNSSFPSIIDATVKVIEMPSNSEIVFTYDASTKSYLPPAGFKGAYGSTYMLEAVIESSTYRSSEQLLKQSGSIVAGIFNEQTGYPRYQSLITEGTYVFYAAIDNVSDGDYYRWQFTVDGTYLSQGDDVRINSDEFLPTGDSIVDQRPLQLEKEETEVTIRQTRINEDIAEFWDQFGSNGTSQGLPFSPPASPLPNNMYNVNDPKEEVFGIFSAESEVSITLTVPK